MNIALITLHDTDNCGSSLQAFALQYYLNSIGNSCEIIDYVPSYTQNNGRPFKTFIKKIIFYKSKRKQDKAFSSFKSTYMKLTKIKYRSLDDLKRNPPKADLYMTGSDQLWNTNFKCGNDDAYCLNFINGVNKVSYAVSLGRSNYGELEIKKLLDRTKEYKKITVREITSKKIFNENGRLDVEHVCDPTLLLDRTVYDKIKIAPYNFPYVFIYLTLESELLDKAIITIREKYPYHKIVYYGSFKPHCDCDIHLKTAGPQEFLGLISEADFIIAGSFHATVFSYIFRKNFIILPSKNNERMIQLLKILNLEDHYILSIQQLNLINENLDYNNIDFEIEKHICESKLVLKEMLNDAE